jgi:hypothetical protein
LALGCSGYTDDVGGVAGRTVFHRPATTSKEMESECFNKLVILLNLRFAILAQGSRSEAVNSGIITSNQSIKPWAFGFDRLCFFSRLLQNAVQHTIAPAEGSFHWAVLSFVISYYGTNRNKFLREPAAARCQADSGNRGAKCEVACAESRTLSPSCVIFHELRPRLPVGKEGRERKSRIERAISRFDDYHVIKATKEISMQHLILLAVVSMMVLYVLTIVACLCYIGRHGHRTS